MLPSVCNIAPNFANFKRLKMTIVVLAIVAVLQIVAIQTLMQQGATLFSDAPTANADGGVNTNRNDSATSTNGDVAAAAAAAATQTQLATARRREKEAASEIAALKRQLVSNKKTASTTTTATTPTAVIPFDATTPTAARAVHALPTTFLHNTPPNLHPTVQVPLDGKWVPRPAIEVRSVFFCFFFVLLFVCNAHVNAISCCV
jgi:hypothetical protein